MSGGPANNQRAGFGRGRRRARSSPSRHDVFFVHVMKTGGATFRRHVYANFDPDEVYPNPSYDDMNDGNWSIEQLLSLPPERRAVIRAYTGHFPFVVTDLLDGHFLTLAILRDPVSRTISYLKHCKRYHEHHRDLSLEEIYDDEFYFRTMIHNHQAKLFSMTTDDRLESYMDVIEIDDDRLEIAKANLARIDLLGLNEHHDEFLAEVEERLAWWIGPVPNQRVSEESWEASPALRRRIASDNAADMEFYAHARTLYEQRRRARGEP